MTLASTSSGQQVKQGLFQRLVGKKLLTVAYPGASPAVLDLVRGNVNLMTSNATSVLQYVKTGKVRAIVFLGDKRVPVLPDVPSAVEAGYPMLDLKEWFGFAMPAKTPRSIIVKLNHDIVSILKSPDVIDKLGSIGQTATFTIPEEMDKQIREEYELFGNIVKEIGLKVE
jgi:tripartite-type tricarboxylate transporter receptor subunit TctC